jgi:hypothetical protein
LFDEIGEGRVCKADHLLSGSVERIDRTKFESVLKSRVLNGLEDFDPERGQVGRLGPKSVLGNHFVDDPRFRIRFFFCRRIVLFLDLHGSPERLDILTLEIENINIKNFSKIEMVLKFSIIAVTV